MAAAKAALTLLLRALRLNEMVNACVTRPISYRYSSGEGIPTTELIPNKQTTTTKKKKRAQRFETTNDGNHHLE